MSGVSDYFPNVVVLKRSVELRADEVPMNDVLLYDTTQVRANLYLQTHSTNPLLKSTTIKRAIEEFKQSIDKYDSLFSVTRWQTRLWNEQTKAINHDPEILLQTQDLPPVFEENSCIYLFTAENLRQRSNRIGKKPLMFEIDKHESIDIDEEVDFLLADLMMKLRQNDELV
jgi:CMP-N-acetylneuraminic acid synthetase